MHEPHINRHTSTRRDEISIVLVIGHNPVWDAYRRAGMPPEYFLDEGIDVRERGAVGERWKPLCAHDGIQLCLRLSLRFGIHRHCHEEGPHFKRQLESRVARLGLSNLMTQK